ncbi:MAG: DNA-3-methyladenine glycosylase I [Burkholderiales bacterium]
MGRPRSRRPPVVRVPHICYAFMQAIGMVNDHLVTCFRYRQLQR